MKNIEIAKQYAERIYDLLKEEKDRSETDDLSEILFENEASHCTTCGKPLLLSKQQIENENNTVMIPVVRENKSTICPFVFCEECLKNHKTGRFLIFAEQMNHHNQNFFKNDDGFDEYRLMKYLSHLFIKMEYYKSLPDTEVNNADS